MTMKPTYEELEHIASEMSQQDWSDLRFADVYYDAFVAGGKWFMRSYERLLKERNELAAKVERLRIVAIESQDWDWLSAKERAEEADHDFFEIDEMQSLSDSARSETPPTALLALKAQCQAEIISELQIHMANNGYCDEAAGVRA